MTHEDSQKKGWNKRRKRRLKALEKIANGGPVECAICGCPHLEILDIGHPNADGKYHRRPVDPVVSGKGYREMVPWVLETPIEEVVKRVQLECPYCNAWHARFREYPPPERQPRWDKD